MRDDAIRNDGSEKGGCDERDTCPEYHETIEHVGQGVAGTRDDQSTRVMNRMVGPFRL